MGTRGEKKSFFKRVSVRLSRVRSKSTLFLRVHCPLLITDRAIDTFANDDNEKHGKYAAELTEDIEGFLSWYMDSYDDFYHKRWNGKVADPVYIEKIKQATIMQVRALVWCFGGSVVVVCVCGRDYRQGDLDELGPPK